MNFTLRDYQQKFVDNIVKLLATYKRIVACSATGSGKSKCFIYLAHRANAKGFTVLILTEATKIYSQLTDELHAGNINADVKDGFIMPGKIYIAMAQTLVRRKKMLEQFIAQGNHLLIINDEAHIGTSTKLLQQLPDALLIGFTATPDFKFAKHLPLLYNAISIGPQPDELVNDGHLCSYQHFARVAANMNDLKLKGGEFTEESQERIFETKKVYEGLLTDLRNVAFNKAIIFTASIKHCDAVTLMLNQAGHHAISVHSKISAAQQSYDMAQFKTIGSQFNICVSVGILTKGWDYPPIDLVVLQRATTSLPLYLQMIGRGSRTYEGKKVFTVLDYGGNYSRHGLWDMDIDWAKKWNQAPKKKKDGVAPVKYCPQCDYINPVSVMVCKNCGHQFTPIEPSKEDEEKTKLIELTQSYRTLIGRKISTLTPFELAIYAKLKNKKAYAARIAKAQTQDGREEFMQTFANAMGYKSGWAYFQSKDLAQTKIEFHDIVLR